jgi:hypothetical protein
MKLNIYKLCFLAAMALLISLTKAEAKTALQSGNYTNRIADTSLNDSYKGMVDVQKNVLEKRQQALQRDQLLDKLSKQPAENPEAFSNAREEFLYFEKARKDGEAYEAAIKELNELIASKILWF